MKEKELNEIRKIAHGLWEQEGRPEGQDRRHWDTAKEIWAFRHSGEDASPAQSRATPSPAPNRSHGRSGQASRRGASA